MSNSISWIKLNIKSIFSHASFYLLAFMLFISLWLLKEISENASEDVRVLIYWEDSSIGKEISETLISNPYMGYSFEPVEDIDKLIYEVRNGYADCGIVFDESFDKNIAKGRLKNSTRFYQYAGSSSSYIVREVVFPFIMRKASNVFITNYAMDKSDNLIDETSLEYITGVNDRFNNETELNIFETITIEGNNEKPRLESGSSIKRIGCVILVILITVVMFTESEYENKNFYKALHPRKVRMRRIESFGVRLVVNSMLLLVISVIL